MGFSPKSRQQTEPARTVGEALAALARELWPENTAKHIQRNWGVKDLSAAENLKKGQASERTITKALKAGGWPVIMAVGEALQGHSYDQHLQQIIEDQERVRQRMASRRERIREMEARARALDDAWGRVAV